MQDPLDAAWGSTGTAQADPLDAAWGSTALPVRQVDPEHASRARFAGRLRTEERAKGTIYADEMGSAPYGSEARDFQHLPPLDDLAKGAAELPIAALNSVPESVGKLASAGGIIADKAGAHRLGKNLQTLGSRMPQIPDIPGTEGGIAQGLGKSLGFTAQAALAPEALGLQGLLALAPGAVLGAAAQGVDDYQHVLEKTGDGEKAWRSFLLGGAVGAGAGALAGAAGQAAFEVGPLAAALNRMNVRSEGALMRSLQDATVFGAGGATQSALNDAILKSATGEDIPILENALKAGGFGALTGLVFGAISNLGGSRSTDRAPAETRPPTIEEVLSREESAGKPHAATADLVQGEQTAIPVEESTATPEVVTAPPGAEGGVGEAVPGEVAPQGKSNAETAPAVERQPVEVQREDAAAGGLAAREDPGEGAASADKGGAAPVARDPRSAPEYPNDPWYPYETGLRPDRESVARMQELLKLPQPRLESELIERLALEDETLRAEKGGRGDAWYQRVAELRRQARDPGNPEAAKAEATLKQLRVRPSGHNVEEVVSALRLRDDQAAAERTARKGTRPSEKFAKSQAARAEVERAWREFGDSLRGKSFSGVDPVVIGKAAKVAKAYVKLGTEGFIQFAHDAIARFGEAIRPHVHDIWRKAGGSPAPLAKRAEITGEEVPAKRALPVKQRATEPVAVEEKRSLPVKAVEPEKHALPVRASAPEEKIRLPVAQKTEAAPAPSAPPEDGFYPSAETKWEAVQRKVADRFVKLRATEQEAPGKGSDFSGAETRMHGRAAHAQDLLERAQDRAVKVMKERGITAQDIADQATARHAPKRNEIISERTKGENTEGSGMSDARAAEVRAKAKPGTDEVLRVHDEVRDRALDFAVESGLVSKDEAKAWREKFGDTFTSLKTISGDEPTAMPGVGKSLQVRGKESKRAEGRTSEATNPFVSTFQNAQDIILRGEKNLVAQEFGKLVKENPGPWAEFVEAEGGHAPSGEDVFSYKENGEPVYIRVHDKGTLKALKNLDPVVAGTALRLAAKAGRMMSSLATSRNPDFVASNLARDLQTAVGNVSTEESVKIAAKIVKDVFPSLRNRSGGALVEIGRAMASPEKATGYAKEYLEHGALTDWIEPTTPQKRLADMETRLAETPLREKLRTLGEALSDLSGSVENGVRFAYFKALRRAGISADEAAVRSKELTVNWSKKGEWSATMNALYLFSSASANGTVRFAQAWERRPLRAAAYAGSLYAAGYLMAMLNDTAGGTDPKDDRKWWDKQADANKRRYAMVQHQSGETTRMPLAPGWGLFYDLGGQGYATHKSGKVDFSDIISATFEQASPIGGGSVGQIVSPWFTDPFVSASENKDFAGRPIYAERDNHDKRPYSALPSEQRGSETAKAISKLANELTGGDDARQGMLDVPPRSLDYVAAEGGSGLGRFMQRVGKTASQALHGEVPMWRDMPIVSRFKGDTPKTYGRDFYAIVDKIEAEHTAMKGGKDFDANVLAYKAAATQAQTTIAKLRAAGADEAADKMQADFIKAFDARKKR